MSVQCPFIWGRLQGQHMMDNYRAFEDGADTYAGAEDEPAIEAPPEIGVDERRMHVRAYNYWVSLLKGRAYPSISDVDPYSLEDFGPHSVLLDFTKGSENPGITFIGRALREECDIDGDIEDVSQVPSRSLISRLTDHYLQIIANRAPIGFEAEFVSQRGHNTMYRGILMPLSSNGETIDFIYGVINWKEVADSNTTANLVREVTRAVASAPVAAAAAVWADGPQADAACEAPLPAIDFDPSLEIGVRYEDDEDQPSFELEPADDAGLYDRLSIARETAEAVKTADARSRTALYRALGQAYDFALAAEQAREDYAEMLEDAGLKAQERAPMTPVVKLIFGIDYDKTRLTEFAAALSYGRRRQLPKGGLVEYLERFSGGLKGIVQAERRERRPAHKADANEAARSALRQALPLTYLDGGTSEGEFVLFVARREPDGRLAVVAPVAADNALMEKAIRKAAH
jgi:hypothetical protein